MGLVEDLGSYLLAEGLVDDVDWTLVYRNMSDEVPDKVVVLTEDGGPDPEIPADAGIGDSAMKDLGIQVMVRGAPWASDETLAKAVEILGSLHGMLNVTLGSTEYLRVIARSGEPAFAGFDERGRPHHSASFLCLTGA